VVLKRPSEYFKKEKLSVNDSVQELVKTPELNTFSDAFESFKNNLSKIEVLSEFSETLDNYRVNIERVNHLSDKVEDIQTEIQNLLNKEDLDRAMMSQLLVVEQSIRDVQSKVKGINEKNLVEIRLDVAGLTETVNEFLENDVPKYKKLVVESELRTNNRYNELENNINLTLEGIGEFVDKKYDELTENLQGINKESLASIIEDFKSLDRIVLQLKDQDIPKYKGFIVETERKTESKLNEFQDKLDETFFEFDSKLNQTVNQSLEIFDEKVDNKINNLQDSIQKIDEKFGELKEQEIPKYRSFIVETERKTESKLNQFDEKLDETVNSILKKIDLIEGDKTDLVDVVNKRIKEIKNIRDYVFEDLKTGEEYKNQISKKVADLEVEIIRNESHIKVQNKNLEQIQENVRSAIQKLNLEELEKKNYELGKKVKYLEEIFEKFSEKEILTENIIIEPPSIDNKDPLTPLDQNFVTLEQLQQHYRLFINRIQQQLATIGGGGETRLEFLDDVDRNSAKQNGYVLQYNSSVGKFIGTSYVPGSGGTGEISIQKDGYPVGTAVTVLNFSGAGISTITAVSGIATITITGGGTESYWISTNVGINTLSNVGIGTTNPTSRLTVSGDGFFTGVVTASSFSGITTSMVIGLSTVSLTGDYNDLTNKPTSLSSFTNDVGFITTYTETDTLNSVTNRGNSTSNGISVGILTASSGNFSGAYVSGNLGIGTTNPQTKLEIDGVLGFGTVHYYMDPSQVFTNIRIGDESTGGNLTPGVAGYFYGYNNIFMGVFAGAATTIGYDNIFLGASAGRNNTTGGHNNFFGNSAGRSNTTGFSNNFFGQIAGSYNTTGCSNNFFGNGAGSYNTTGSFNSFFGRYSGNYNTIGSKNNFFGAYTGLSTSASNKVILGSGYDYSSFFDAPNTTKDTQFAVGVRTDANPSKYWIVGNENFNIGMGTTNPTSKLTVTGDVLVSGILTASSGNFSDIVTSSGLSISGVSTLGIVTSGDIFSTGIITATSFYGSGLNLTDTRIGISSGGSVLGTAGTINFTGTGISTIIVSSGIATINIPATVRNTSSTIAYEGQTIFPCSYTIGYVEVYFNGSKLSSTQYTAPDGANIILVEPASANDIVETIGYTGILKLYASKTILTEVSSDGLTFYTGKAAVGVTTTDPYWTIRRSLFSTAGIVTSVGIARNVSWINRSTATYV
jgi:hypothetical protein